MSRYVSPSKLLFFCGEQSPWGYAHLEPLLSVTDLEIVAVVLATKSRWSIFRQKLTGEVPEQPRLIDRIRGLKRKLLHPQEQNATQKALALLTKHQIPIVWSDDANSPHELEVFRGFSADLIFSAAYPQIFRPALLSLCSRGAINSHPSLLPRCRGAHPVFWAIASGETCSGSTIHYMTDKIDRGDIIAQVESAISPTDTRSSLYNKLIATIPELISQTEKFLNTPNATAKPQIHANSTYFRNDRAIHHRIFWSKMNALQVNNLVRACEGGAFFWHDGRRFNIANAEVGETNRNMTNNLAVPPGTVVDLYENRPVVSTCKGFVTLEVISSRYRPQRKFAIGEILG